MYRQINGNLSGLIQAKEDTMLKQRAETFKIKLAGVVVRIEPLYDYIKTYCKAFLTEETENFSVRTEQSDIVYERKKSEAEDIREGNAIRQFDAPYLETLAVYRKITEQLLTSNILLFHGSVIAVDGIGYLFTAKSGTGKSTHTRLWREQFGERAVMINDDKPLLELTEHGVMVHGTPWAGKHNLCTNGSVPLKAICVLNRAETNYIEAISPREIYGMLLQQVYRPANIEAMQQTMKHIDTLMERVDFYRLGCNMEPEAALISYEGMNTNGGTV